MEVLYKPPKELHNKARKYMADLVKLLSEAENVTKLDKGALILLGNALHKYFSAQDILFSEGYIRQGEIHPASKLVHEAEVEILKLLVEFNLTPKRRRTSGIKPPEPSEGMAPIDQFLNSQREVR
ncbi:MAG: P27 family phage terminase small subunit [Bacteroidales bacterium]|nr:P27 family phage terminase small subunit [Bacteroidales bacterium]